MQDVKIALAQQAGGMDPNRLGIFDSKKKILKDHKALIGKNKDVLDAQEVFVKDLGMNDTLVALLTRLQWSGVVPECVDG